MNIDINVSELLNIAKTDCEILQSNLQVVITKLLNSYDGVLNCVQSSELNKTIRVLKNDVENVTNKLLRNLPQTTEYLRTQMTSYDRTNQIAKDAVEGLIARINSYTDLVG